MQTPGHRARARLEFWRPLAGSRKATLTSPYWTSGRDIWSKLSLKMHRKRIITRSLHTPPAEQGWLDVESTASVEITSEDDAFPIESALLQRDKGGWRAAEPGVQTIRLIFGQPQRLRRILVVFEETERKRTQEFTLR